MVRQLGGAFGIAVANNYIASRYAQHRSDLVSAMPEGSYQITERLHAISESIISKTGDVSGAVQKAQLAINASVEKQAYYLSYLDTFRLIGVFFLLVTPLVIFLRVKKKTPMEMEMAKKSISESH
jgi:DHA2 family multidrug resistance protein